MNASTEARLLLCIAGLMLLEATIGGAVASHVLTNLDERSLRSFDTAVDFRVLPRTRLDRHRARRRPNRRDPVAAHGRVAHRRRRRAVLRQHRVRHVRRAARGALGRALRRRRVDGRVACVRDRRLAPIGLTTLSAYASGVARASSRKSARRAPGTRSRPRPPRAGSRLADVRPGSVFTSRHQIPPSSPFGSRRGCKRRASARDARAARDPAHAPSARR